MKNCINVYINVLHCCTINMVILKKAFDICYHIWKRKVEFEKMNTIF